MRLLNRSATAGRSSPGTAADRSPGSWCCCSGLLLTGSLYAAFAPAQAAAGGDRRRAGREGPRALPRRLRVLPRPERRGRQDPATATRSARSLVGVGAAAVDFQVGTGRMPMAQPGAQVPRKKPIYTDEEIAALAAYVASLGPGPAIPDADRLQHRGPVRRGARGGHRPRRPDLPDQLHGLPQLRGLRRRDAARRLRPEDPRRRAASTSTRPC